MSLFSFKDVCQDVTKTATKIPTSEYLEKGKYVIFDQGKSFVAGYTNNSLGVANEFPYIVFGDHTRVVKYVDVPCFIGADGVKLLKVKISNFDSKYVYYTLLNFPITSQGYSRHFKYLKECVFVERSLVEQNRIVAELDKIQEAIDNKRQQLAKLNELVNSKFYEMFGDPIANPKGWETKKFSSCFKLSSGDALSTKQIIEGIYPVYGGNGITGYHNTYNLNGENIIIGRVGALCGNVRLINEPIFATDNAFILMNLSPLINVFIQHLLTHINLRQYAKEAAQPVISNISLKDIMVIIPPLELQEQFANFAQKIEQAKDVVSKQIDYLQELLDSRMDFYFRQ